MTISIKWNSIKWLFAVESSVFLSCWHKTFLCKVSKTRILIYFFILYVWRTVFDFLCQKMNILQNNFGSCSKVGGSICHKTFDQKWGPWDQISGDRNRRSKLSAKLIWRSKLFLQNWSGDRKALGGHHFKVFFFNLT